MPDPATAQASFGDDPPDDHRELQSAASPSRYVSIDCASLVYHGIRRVGKGVSLAFWFRFGHVGNNSIPLAPDRNTLQTEGVGGTFDSISHSQRLIVRLELYYERLVLTVQRILERLAILLLNLGALRRLSILSLRNNLFDRGGRKPCHVI
jgi:hypothetical protein